MKDHSLVLLFSARAMILYGATHGTRAVVEWSMLGDSAPLNARTVATAYLSTVFNIGSAFGAVAAGALSVLTDMPSLFKLASIIFLSRVIIAMLQLKSTKNNDRASWT